MAAQDWEAGDRVTAERLANMLHKQAEWIPTWTTTSGDADPNYGNASIECSYSQSGDLVVAHFEVIFGSTTNFGSGPTTADNWIFSLPVEAANPDADPTGDFFLQATLESRVVARTNFFDEDHFLLEIGSNRLNTTAITNLGFVDALTPWTWASAYTIKGVLEYEAA